MSNNERLGASFGIDITNLKAGLAQANRLIKESRFVTYASGRLRVFFEGRTLFDKAYKECPDTRVLEDVGTVEVFLDGGRENITLFIC